MSRTLFTVAAPFAVAAAALGGCSLVWTPVVDQPGPDAGPDAFEIDAYEPDAYMLDAFVPIDAWSPPELCTGELDEDGDTLADCNDPDCFRDPVCCNPEVGTDLGSMALGAMALPSEWSSRDLDRTTTSSAIRLRATGTAPVGALWRNNCVPLGQGGRFEVRLGGMPTPGSGESASIVLSPAREPGPSGFLDELSIVIDDQNIARVTRAGRVVTLDSVACTSGTGVQLGPETTFVIDLLPGVSGSRSALIASLHVTSSGGACRSTTTLFTDEVILSEDLVRTPEDGSRSCQDSPGLYFALEVRPGTSGTGVFSLVPLTGSTPSIVLRSLECASPGVFNRAPLVLDRTSIDVESAPYTRGGIGAPDLEPEASTDSWRLAYDASVEDRSEELFRSLTLSVGVSEGASYDADDWTPTPTHPLTAVGARAREPSLTIRGVADPYLVWAREMGAGSGSYEIARGIYDPAGQVLGPTALITPMPMGVDVRCSSLREPTSIPSHGSDGTVDGDWIFARCDLLASSTLGLWRRAGASTTLVTANVLGTSAGQDRVIAADVLSSAQGEDRFFALWVLVRGPTDEAEVRLYLADHIPVGDAEPTFVPYAGNPILRMDDGSLPACPTGATCRLTSMSVARIAMSGPDRLRFLFARARTGASPAYELIAAEQTSLRGLEGP